MDDFECRGRRSPYREWRSRTPRVGRSIPSVRGCRMPTTTRSCECRAARSVHSKPVSGFPTLVPAACCVSASILRGGAKLRCIRRSCLSAHSNNRWTCDGSQTEGYPGCWSGTSSATGYLSLSRTLKSGRTKSMYLNQGSAEMTVRSMRCGAGIGSSSRRRQQGV